MGTTSTDIKSGLTSTTAYAHITQSPLRQRKLRSISVPRFDRSLLVEPLPRVSLGAKRYSRSSYLVNCGCGKPKSWLRWWLDGGNQPHAGRSEYILMPKSAPLIDCFHPLVLRILKAAEIKESYSLSATEEASSSELKYPMLSNSAA
jgi:hypothetical protein